jgi:RNA polymerase sigma-70 factor (ECF subfamily)
MERFSFDDDYVRRLREGDRETAAHFFSYFRDLLLAKLRRRLRTMEAVEEVRQEVFLRVLERLDQVRDGRKLGAFVNSVCTNVLLEHYRGERRAVALDEDSPYADTFDVESAYDTIRSTNRVRRVLSSLEPRDAEILRAAFLEEGDKGEICRRYGIEREYLRVLLHRAKEKFRTAYIRRKSGRMEIDETFGRLGSLLM